MKKLLGWTLALAILLPYSPAAYADELLKNLKFDGQIDVQATSANNTSDFATRAVGATTNRDTIGDVQTRLMLTGTYDLLDDVHGKVTVRKSDRNYGTTGGNGSATGNSQNLVGAKGGTDVAGNVFVDQAFFKVDKVFGAVDATFGRQFFGTSGDLVIYFGPSDKAWYGLPVSALDAVRGDWSNDSVGVTALMGKITGAAIGAGNVSGNIDLQGVTAMLKGHDNLNGSVYLWNKETHNTGAAGAADGKNDNLYVLGAKGKATMGNAWVKGEVVKDFGENRTIGSAGPSANYTGWGFLADAGVKADVSGVGSVTPWGQFGFGTGQGDANSNHNRNLTLINSDYRPGGIWSRFASVAGLSGELGGATTLTGLGTLDAPGLSNRVIVGVGAKVNPSSISKLTAGVEVWDIRSQTSIVPTPSGGSAAFGGNKHIGSEVDLVANWQHSENVGFNAGVGSFQPGGLIKNANTVTNGGETNPATLAFMDVRVKFGGSK